MLYLVATPIGNLEDITWRAVRILREVRLIAAEDTRHTIKLLNHLEIKTPLTSYHDFSTPQKLEQLLQELQQGDVALVSDAGMPGLSDPGYELVRVAIEAGIAVCPIPGPTAAISALVASGLPTDRFLFLGFLPRQLTGRQESLQEVANLPYTLVLYEAPHRLRELLEDALQILGNRPLCIARELTKLHEELWRGTITEALTYFSEDKIRGELTVVIGGRPAGNEQWDEQRVRHTLQQQLQQGVSVKDAVAAVMSASGWRKKAVYALALDLNQSE
jgi:16S rRNA (cytidine1402-2'-O)-methyltransferase